MAHDPALALADQIRTHARGSLDHLKLQKLCFYVYGAALAFDVAQEMGVIEFEAWKHGPVNRTVWQAFKSYKADTLPPAEVTAAYENATLRATLEDVMEVYGRMTSWSIRCESHLEQPWIRAAQGGRPLDQGEIREHFKRKLAPGGVTMPVYLSGARSAALDGIPQARFDSLNELAQALRNLDS